MTWRVESVDFAYGRTRALHDVSVACPAGEITAVVGGDGAGKSTLLRIFAGIARPGGGTTTLPRPGNIGYVPPTGGVFPDLSVDEHMDFAAAAYRLRGWEPRALHLMERTGLGESRARLAGKLSGGQRRKLGAMMALLPQPALLVMDEVTTGVDPVSRMELWRLIAGAAAAGSAVVFATGYLDEAERAGGVALLHDGRVLAAGPPVSVIAGTPGSISDAPAAPRELRSWRRGRTWRVWNPHGTRMATDEITLEDAAIVAELQAEARA